jgi:ABC-type glycerol-3-phosphate transport system substrate-binding protein
MLYPQQRPDITPTFGVTAVNGLVMSANARNKTLAKEFVKWVMSKQRQEAVAAVGGLTPSRTDISAAALAGQGPVLGDILSKFKTVGVGFWWEDTEPLPVATAVDNGLSLLMAGQTTPQQIGKSAEAAATKLRTGQ